MREKNLSIMFAGIFVLAAGLCFGQQTLVVPPCYSRGAGFSADELTTVTDLITNALQRQGRFDVPDREALALMTAEQKFQTSDWSDDIKSIQMGKAINANYLARSIIAPLDGTVKLLQIRILDVNTAQILGRAQELEFSTLRDLRGKLDAFLQEVTATIRANKTNVVPGTYKTGDRGPAGGWVFYDKGLVSDGWRYLEAAPPEMEFRAGWEAALSQYHPLVAAGNWRLPTKEELELMYKNLKQKGIGGFSNMLYWSSSQYNSSNSWVQDFGGGWQDFSPKNGTLAVRCVRAF
jgi:hypothetical protein